MMDWMGWQELIPSWFDMVYAGIFAGIFICYLIIRVVVKWVVSLQSIKLLTYMMSSLVFLVLFLLGIVFTAWLDVNLLEISLQCLAVFGCCLFLLHLMQYVYHKSRKKRLS